MRGKKDRAWMPWLMALAIAALPVAQDVQAAPEKKAAASKQVANGKTASRKVAKPANMAAKKAGTSRSARSKAASATRVAAVAARHAAHAGASLEEAQNLVLQSASALVLDQSSGQLMFEKNADAVVPIASLTKLMTAMVTLDAHLPLKEMLTISEDDVDTLKGTRSRLKVGTRLSREDMLLLALMSSENRAASALARHYPGGREAFIQAMNRKARKLGMSETQFADPTGLTSANVSSARDLVRLVDAAHRYPLIREFSTRTEYEVEIDGRPQLFRNTNALVRSPQWEIGLSKTGFINEAGKCLVMQAWIGGKPTIIVLLDSWGKMTRIGDANRIKRWVESVAVASRLLEG